MRKLGYRGIYRERTNGPKYVWAIARTNDNLSRNSFIAYEKDTRLYDRSWQRDCGITFYLEEEIGSLIGANESDETVARQIGDSARIALLLV